jgi:antirestriction protein
MKKTQELIEELIEELMLQTSTKDEDAIKAYIEIVGEDYATAGGFEESYQGSFSSDEDFARDMAENTCDVNFRNLSWPMYCIDWEYAAKELMMDYSEAEGYYFRNL